MKKTKMRVFSAAAVLTMALSGNVFAATDLITPTAEITADISEFSVEYRGHIQNTGDYPLDNSWIQGPDELGTEGQGLRLEGFWIELTGDVPDGAHIEYQVHVENEGWMDWVADGEFAGTEGKSERIEAIRIRLVDDSGNTLSGYSVQYRGHIQDQGDTDWVSDGEDLGTTGLGRRLEALEVQIVTTDSSDNSTDEDTDEASDESSEIYSFVTSPTSTIELDTEFSKRELSGTYDESDATQVIFNGSDISVDGDGAAVDGNTLNITAAGTYIVSGDLSDGQILVNAGDDDKVQIVLNGVSIYNSTNAPIYLLNADKVFITLADGTTNTLTDNSDEYIQTDDNTVDAVIFSKTDLCLNGTGTLNITANYQHAIVSKDDLVITGGTYNISAVDNCLKGKDALKVYDGVFNLNSSGGKGLTSKNDDDSTRGYVYIADGTFNIENCTEGIEGTAVIIEDGIIDITATDDGLNAASATSDDTTTDISDPAAGEMPTMPDDGTMPDGTMPDDGTRPTKPDDGTMPDDGTQPDGGGGMMGTDTNAYISIAGGTINIDAQGDGIDSNGNLYISGGTVLVSGPTSSGNGALDYDGTADISGGTVVFAGSSGMVQNFSDTSTQAAMLYTFSSTVSGGTELSLTDADGNMLVSYSPVKDYQTVIISTPAIAVGSTYTLTAGSESTTIEQTDTITGGGNQGGGGPGGDMGDRPDPGLDPMTPPTDTEI
ncbi:carbohydrate-binding domain-containing protein [Eubacteriaceae bacterium ES3]|nr:carbohydrate-binding domain-containing protein [Eubacteriaceae bacterium ES3]